MDATIRDALLVGAAQICDAEGGAVSVIDILETPKGITAVLTIKGLPREKEDWLDDEIFKEVSRQILSELPDVDSVVLDKPNLNSTRNGMPKPDIKLLREQADLLCRAYPGVSIVEIHDLGTGYMLVLGGFGEEQWNSGQLRKLARELEVLQGVESVSADFSSGDKGKH